MNSTKEQDLKAAIAKIQNKFGANAIRQGSIEQTPEYLSTGFPPLNNLIGGGVMRGSFTEFVGMPTSGMMTLALNLIAQSQKIGNGAMYIDLASTFDPSSARFCGVNVPELTLMRYDFETSLSVLYDIVANTFAGVVVFNTLPQLPQKQQLALADTINRLKPILPLSQCFLVVLSLAHKGHSLISQYANLRLHTAFKRKLLANSELEGYQTDVTVLKHKKGNEGKRVTLQIMLDPKISGWET